MERPSQLDVWRAFEICSPLLSLGQGLFGALSLSSGCLPDIWIVKESVLQWPSWWLCLPWSLQGLVEV